MHLSADRLSGKYENERWSEIECSQAVDEQWVVIAVGLPNNWLQNSSQLLSERLLSHISMRSALNWPV